MIIPFAEDDASYYLSFRFRRFCLTFNCAIESTNRIGTSSTTVTTKNNTAVERVYYLRLPFLLLFMFFPGLISISISSFAHNIENRVELPWLDFVRNSSLRKNQRRVVAHLKHLKIEGPCLNACVCWNRRRRHCQFLSSSALRYPIMKSAL